MSLIGEGGARFGAQDVSRETMERLEHYAALLRKWNPAINLVSKSTLEELWTRHFLDSAQIYDHCPEGAQHWVDLGSGGGFPGLVIAILAAENRPGLRVTLVESDIRKATFLRTVARETKVSVQVLSDRIEHLPPLSADVLSARALAALPQLLEYAARHMAADGLALFPKGATHAEELDAARKIWTFSCNALASQTDPRSVILAIGGLAHV
ncbi:16S rRNA (guanine(527)-N(7))-methyltransferase RsmG [Thioclava sp. BHET1]|nr:16S rRNA (guanine(527)-N(7))-methyltransferase RsmG [Thioclava sp. BHET1]